MATESTSLIINDNKNTIVGGVGLESSPTNKEKRICQHVCSWIRHRSFCTVMFLLLVLVCSSPFLFRVCVYYFQNDIPFYLPTHQHSVPTLLYVRDRKKTSVDDDDDGGTFVYVDALENDVYDSMKNARFLAESTTDSINNDEIQSYNLVLDKKTVSFHDSIKLRWTYEESSTSRSKKDEDIIALYCPASEQRPNQFLDAATLRQAEITSFVAVTDTTSSSRYKEEEEEEPHQNEWFIPSFPAVKYASCEFRLWAKIPEEGKERGKQQQQQQQTYQLVSTAPFEIQNGSTQPTNLHLAFTNDVSEMSISFSTGLDGLPVVVYGTSKQDVYPQQFPNIETYNETQSFYYHNDGDNAEIYVRTGTSQTYTSKDLCEGPANIEEPGKFLSPGMLHTIVMIGLESDTLYFYKVGVLVEVQSNGEQKDDEALYNVVWSDVYPFKSSIASGETPSFSSTEGGRDITEESITKDQIEGEIPMKLVVYADQGLPGFDRENIGDVTSTWSKREVETHDIRAVHHFGDLAYAMGSSHIWDAWMDSVSTFASSVPLMVGIGNHEYDHIDGGQHGKDPSGILSSHGYTPSWGDFRSDSYGECAVPVTKRFTMPPNGNGVFWYSFDQGLVHTIMLSSEHDTSPNSDQYSWLERDLQSIDRTKTPWVILEIHRPMYMIENKYEDTIIGAHMRHNFEHLLQYHDVDLVLSGHYHSYFRSCLGLYKEQCNNGGPLYVTIGTAGAALDRGVPLLRKPWSELHLLEWGYGRLSVYREKMLLEFVSDVDGSVKDSYWLHK